MKSVENMCRYLLPTPLSLVTGPDYKAEAYAGVLELPA
jgi:hypothetical protein